MNALPQPPFYDHEPLRQVPGRRGQRTWKKWLIYITGGLFALSVVVVIGVFLVLRSQRFHNYVLQTVQQKASEALGTKARVRDFHLKLAGAAAWTILDDVVVEGAAPYASPPLLAVDSIRVQVTVTSFLHKNWYVNDIRIDHPVLHILTDKAGRTNIPQSKQSGNSSGTQELFDIGIRHFALDRGEIYYNDKKGDLAADLRDLSLHSGFDPSQIRYEGTLSYRNGHLQWQNSQTIEHSLDARFMATPDQFALTSATLKTTRSSISMSATARNFSQPLIHATYEMLVDCGEFRKVLKNPSLPVGTISVSGVVDSESVPNRPLLATTKVNGRISSSDLRVPVRQATASIRNLGANYALSNGNASVKEVHAALLGGSVTGTLLMHDLTGATKSDLSMNVRNISIADVQSLTKPPGPNQAPPVHGTISGDAHAKWGKTLNDMVVRANATLQAAMQAGHGGPETPVTGAIHAEYAAPSKTLSFRQSDLRTPQTTVSINGTVSNRSSLQVRADTRELHEFELLASGFQAPGSKPLDLHGRATTTVTVTGSTQKPQIQGQFTGTNLKVHGTTWKSLRGQFAANSSLVRIENVELLPATQGQIRFSVSSGLQEWAPDKTTPFGVRLVASGLNVAELTKAAGLTTPISGTLTANVQGSGTQLAPKGNGKIQLGNAKIADEPFRAVNLNFNADGTWVDVKLDANLNAGSGTADVRYAPKQQAYQASVRASNIRLDRLETVKEKNLQLTGVLNVNAEGRGTLNDPAMTATVEVPSLKLRDQVINGLKLDAEVANHLAKFKLNSQFLQTHAAGHGTVQLTGDYLADIAFDTQSIPLQPLMAMYSPQQAADLTGQTELHATLRGPLKNKSAMEAHILIPGLNVNYKNAIQLATAAPIRADYVKGVLDVKRSVIRGTGTELAFQAHVPAAKNAPASLLLQGKVDLRLAQMVSPDVTSGGELQFDIDSFGALSNPNVQGQIRIVNASFAQSGVPLGLSNGNGVLTLTRDRLNVTEFKGRVGGGSVAASGGIIYRPDLQFDLGMQADKVRVLYEQSIRTTIGSKLALTGRIDNAQLQGQVNVEDLSFTSNFDLMDFANEVGGGETTPPPTGGFSDQLRLQVAIQTPGGINMTSRTLSMAGQANLQVRGTAAQPVILGRVNLSEGELIFSGNRYIVQGGTIDFRNPTRTDPVADISANTKIQQYDIQMHFWGPVDHLHTNYSSDPALPPADIINLVAFGKTSEAAAANPTPPGAVGAESLVASQVSSQVTSRVEKIAGLSQLSIDPQFGSSQQSPGARIAVQQHVTSKIFVTFATDVTATQQQAIKLEYRLTPKSSFTAVRDQNGGFSFETSFTKGW